MKFNYTYRNTGLELWQLSMYYMYGSMAGVCNVIFTAAVLALTVSRWELAGVKMRAVMILGCSLFTIIQPCLVYVKAGRQARGIKEDTGLEFDDQGIHIRQGGKQSDVKWNAIKKVSRKPTMIVIFSDTTHGFVLTNRVLGDERETFYQFLLSKVK